MAEARTNLEGLPIDIAVAITRFGLAMNDCGGIAIGDERAFFTTGNVAAQRRGELVAVIKAALATTAPATLPAADTVTLGASIETPDTDLTFTELFGEPGPDPTVHCTPAVAAFLAEHPEVAHG